MILKQMVSLAAAGLFTAAFVFSCSVDNNENGSGSNSAENNYSSSEFTSSSSENGTNSSSSKFIVPALIEPAWPPSNIKISSIRDFAIYASSLDQSELNVSFGKERMILDPREETNENCESISFDFMDMSTGSKSGNGYLLGLNSERDYSGITKDCKYIWKTEIGNFNMDVPFVLDATPPVIELKASTSTATNFLRFSTNEDLRLAFFFLKNKDGSNFAFYKISNVIAREFGLWLEDFKTIDDNQSISVLDEGKYEVVAYAFDGSIASVEQYKLLNNVVGGVSTIFDLLDKDDVKYAGMNFSMKSDSMMVDSKKLKSSSSLSYSSSSSMSLNYGGKIYRTVVIGEQTWMAENLNYETASGSSCYKNEKSGCDKYGRLYDWETAMEVCPEGWHLPSSNEWDELIEYVGGYSVAGIKLKSASGWNYYNGTDDYDFSALPGGLYTAKGVFTDAGYFGYWWSASDGYFIEIASERISMFNNISIKTYGHSVRCVKD